MGQPKRFNNYGNLDSNVVDTVVTEKEQILNKMAQNRNKNDDLQKKTKSEFELINEIMRSKDKLLTKMSVSMLTESDKNLVTILENHKNYLNVIDEYIDNLTKTKSKLAECVTMLENKLQQKHCILEIVIKGKTIGKINDVIYCDNFDELTNTHSLQFDTKNIESKIKIIDNTKRQLVFQMVYEGGTTMTYNVKFDLINIDKSTGIVKGNFTSMRQ